MRRWPGGSRSAPRRRLRRRLILVEGQTGEHRPGHGRWRGDPDRGRGHGDRRQARHRCGWTARCSAAPMSEVRSGCRAWRSDRRRPDRPGIGYLPPNYWKNRRSEIPPRRRRRAGVVDARAGSIACILAHDQIASQVAASGESDGRVMRELRSPGRPARASRFRCGFGQDAAASGRGRTATAVWQSMPEDAGGILQGTGRHRRNHGRRTDDHR